MASRQAGVTREEVQTAIARVLLERVREDKYPSWTHIQLIEQVIPESLQREYINVLLEKVLADSYPSIPMLRHIVGLTERM
jgi:hypothetical protein